MEIKDNRVVGEFDGCKFALTEEEVVMYLRGEVEGITPLFTNAELFEIEKMFDFMAGEHLSRASGLLNVLSHFDAKDLPQKIIDDMNRIFMLCRTISSKCNSIRKKTKE